ncbi:PQ loop repeat family protein [Cryptosporidium muris RN66]|uniref:Mannose-P-dolichol utilization defect 1 protein homolog n=1 Tax=Cryptosporidium muris (strain RN66) TaxID=441375 RepID=B6AE52_CRYMR|nr:PQ loop repeat family protein [Cryptosporidium muris RN66]EEA06493.1 PQ loop repeat family protein [Cryptosporidium muris RN66]|eukprot:XP_002140842.1 PQ loop repeat family protein [Cryptosporidium muris RN66]
MYLFISNYLNYAIIIGSSIVKIPQIIQIIKSRSISGISTFGIYIATISCIIYSYYNWVFQIPYLLWIDNCFVGIQNIIILILCILLSEKDTKKINKHSNIMNTFYIVSLSILIILLYNNMISLTILKYLSLTPVIFIILSMVPQILKCFYEGNTGELSFISFLLLCGGAWSRFLTVLISNSKGNKILLLTTITSALLNTIPLYQIIYYQYILGRKNIRYKLNGEYSTRRNNKKSE